MKNSALPVIAIVVLALVLTDLILWFAASGSLSGTDDRYTYLSYYPDSLRSIRLLTVISLLLLTSSGYMLTTAKAGYAKTAGLLLGMACALLTMIKIYSFL